VKYVNLRAGLLLVSVWLAFGDATLAAERRRAAEDYVAEPMPQGFQIVRTELEGPVFADPTGLTLYRWPINGQRGGQAGESPGKPECYDVRYREGAGLYSPYPAGTILPNADTRPTCTQHWRPVLAKPGARSVGNWYILDRTDGTKQWAYKQYPLYTSHLDHRPGDTFGGQTRDQGKSGDNGVHRKPVKPTPNIPSQFEIAEKLRGRMLTLSDGYAVYTFDGDTPEKTTCVDRCLDMWTPVLAPDAAFAQGDWTFLHRPGGGKQWVFRGKPLYRYLDDSGAGSYDGSDVAGWQNVFIQKAPNLPKGFQVALSNGGEVITEQNGRTIYYYSCAEDSPDTLFCDSPDASQEYRLAVCGHGDPELCLKTFPYVLASKNDKSDSNAWSIMAINPTTGKVAGPGENSLRVWAYRARPIYTFSYDKAPGDIGADGWGSDHGARNGFTAFWVRDYWGGIAGRSD